MTKVWKLEKEQEGLISLIREKRQGKRDAIRASVGEIRQEVINGGEAAIRALSMKWDKWKEDYPFKVSEDELKIAASQVTKENIEVLKGMISQVRAFHMSQRGRSRTFKRKGLIVKEDHCPVEKVLVYVPGGKASYPSSLVMGVVPAQIAGVKEIYIACPTPYGLLDPYVAAAALILGTTAVYRIGGAQAIYAFSFGVGTIPMVDMIVGPGNAYVEEAKRDVYGQVGIDIPAGPTELIILCTAPFQAEVVALDLLSQAEHDEMATIGLFSPSKGHIMAVIKEMERLTMINERKEVIEKATSGGIFVHYHEPERAIETINLIAPEHLELIGDESLAERLFYPGIIYLGPYTPVAMGDYYIGTNHILPTAGAGRFAGGLSVDSFKRRRTIVKAEGSFLDRYGDKAVKLSRIEGLFAHGEAIKARKGLIE